MMEKMRKKENPLALLVGIYIGTATNENSMEIRFFFFVIAFVV